jgi:hypothetical protein
LSKITFWLYRGLGALSLLTALALDPAVADLRTPAWYDVNAVGAAPDWHYRVAIQVPAGAPVRSTVKVDVDFTAVLATMNVIGTLDVNSPRLVRPGGAIVAVQEFTDRLFAGATDAVNNNRGEIRFIAEDLGPSTYYLYFDIAANGAKPVNPQTPINGNFERGGAGTSAPPGWGTPTVQAGFDAQIRPAETVSITASPAAVDGVQTRNTDGNPLTGGFSYLIGLRSVGTQIAGNPGVVLSKTINVPAGAAPGSLTFRWRPEGWDSVFYDYLRVEIVDGASVTELVGPTYGNYTTAPSSPNQGGNAVQASATSFGYRQYNGYDCTVPGTHLSGMAVPCHAQPWWTRTVNLLPWAGKTITLRFRAYTDTADRTWWHIDDLEWSVVAGTVGGAEAFGTSITQPNTSGTYNAGQVLTIAAQMNAAPNGSANQVTAEVRNPAGTVVATGIRLYNDGTHGDAVANDSVWTNNGTVAANPTYTFPAAVATSSNWMVRVFARDASSSSSGASFNGLARIPAASAAQTQANFFNIDEQLFTLNGISLRVTKSSAVISDPVNGLASPKNIPGAVLQYSILVSNEGVVSPDLNTVRIVDPVPANVELFVGDISGSGSGPIQFVNSAPSSTLTYSFASLASITDDLEFSKDGGVTWAALVVNLGGYDAAVTHIRVSPKGTMALPSGAGNPGFELRFRARVK